MKNLFKLILLIFSLALINSCAEDDMPNPTYNAGSRLYFSETEGSKAVSHSVNHVDVEVPFSTIASVSGSQTVKLNFLNSESSAVLGTDFTIVNPEVTLAAGQNKGSFTVRIFSAPMTVLAKVAKFSLSSPTIANATWNQVYTLSMTQLCDVSSFAGDFQYSTGFWQDPGGYEIQPVAGQANTMKIVDFLKPGVDFIFKYDATGKVTFATQNTGETYPGYGAISVRMDTYDATKVSTMDLCSRKLTLYANYFVPGGVFTDDDGNKTIKEVFTGL